MTQLAIQLLGDFCLTPGNAQAIQQKRPSPITVADGRQVLQLLDAVFASGKTGKPVRLA
ncbi:MAG: hypothetical protein HC804_10820 [Anaerolineae bacterium]|nr:hypothetical protein [Anaerolineae bacterium]